MISPKSQESNADDRSDRPSPLTMAILLALLVAAAIVLYLVPPLSLTTGAVYGHF